MSYGVDDEENPNKMAKLRKRLMSPRIVAKQRLLMQIIVMLV